MAQVIESVEQGEGIRFRELLEQLCPDPDGAEAALAIILDAAPARVEQHLEQWESTIAAVVAAKNGEPLNEDAAMALDQHAETTDWGAFVAALRRIIAGERDEQALLVGLDGIETAIVREVLSRIGRKPES